MEEEPKDLTLKPPEIILPKLDDPGLQSCLQQIKAAATYQVEAYNLILTVMNSQFKARPTFYEMLSRLRYNIPKRSANLYSKGEQFLQAPPELIEDAKLYVDAQELERVEANFSDQITYAVRQGQFQVNQIKVDLIEQKSLSQLAISQYEKKFAPMQPVLNKCDALSHKNKEILRSMTLKAYLKMKKKSYFNSFARQVRIQAAQKKQLNKVLKLMTKKTEKRALWLFRLNVRWINPELKRETQVYYRRNRMLKTKDSNGRERRPGSTSGGSSIRSGKTNQKINPVRTRQVFDDMKLLLESTFQKMQSEHRHEQLKTHIGIRKLEEKINEKAELGAYSQLESKIESVKKQLLNLALNTSLHHERRLHEIQRSLSDPAAQALAKQVINCANQINIIKHQLRRDEQQISRKQDQSFGGDESPLVRGDLAQVDGGPSFEPKRSEKELTKLIYPQPLDQDQQEDTAGGDRLAELHRTTSEATEEFIPHRQFSRPSTSHSRSRTIFVKHRVDVSRRKQPEALYGALTAKSMKLSSKDLKPRSKSGSPQPMQDSSDQAGDYLQEMQHQQQKGRETVGGRLIGMTGFRLGAERGSRTNVRKYSETFGKEPILDTSTSFRIKRSSVGSDLPSQDTSGLQSVLDRYETRSPIMRNPSHRKMYQKISRRPQTSEGSSRMFPKGLAVQAKHAHNSSFVLQKGAGGVTQLVHYPGRKNASIWGEI